MSITVVNEAIPVLASFANSRVEPVAFRFSGRRYQVNRLNLHHTKPAGTDTLHYFAVTTELGDCILCYSSERQRWTLVEIGFDG